MALGRMVIHSETRTLFYGVRGYKLDLIRLKMFDRLTWNPSVVKGAAEPFVCG